MATKLIHLTDPHLVPPGEPLYGLDPLARLRAALAEVNRAHADANLVLITGDLTDRGEPPAYCGLRAALAGLAVPHALLMGNHDRRDAFLDVFPEAPRTAEGFVQFVIDTPDARIVCLDSLEPGSDAGRLCARRLGWLEATLKANHGRDVLVAVHHPPMAVGMPVMDGIALRDGAVLGDLLVRHGRVRHLLFGHVHRPIAGAWRGIPFTTQRGVSHQCSLGLTAATFHGSHEPPAMGIVLLDGEQVVVHGHDFLGGAARFRFGDERAARARTPAELPPFSRPS
jgi:Icc protein